MNQQEPKKQEAAGLGASMVGLEFRPEPLPESLPMRQTRPRIRSDVNDHLEQKGPTMQQSLTPA
ncbi:MAG: hypothetical protein DMG51_08935 [Acidobacteria bacterium]|nr:MAG: hypothetical protein DMG51_08935 [Acidobacteriota bacterium]